MFPNRSAKALLAIATCLPGAASAATVVTLDPGPVAGDPSLAIGADGLPVVAYRTLNSVLRVAKCRQWDCQSPMVIEIPGGYFASASMAMAVAPDGNPAIAYRDSATRQLMLVKCATPDCTGGGHVFRTIDAGPGDVGSHVDLAFGPDGRAALAYQEYATGAIKLARCTSPGCGSVQIEVLRESTQVTYAEEVALAFGGRPEPAIASRWSNLQDTAANFFDCTLQPCGDSLQQLGYAHGLERGFGISLAISPTDFPVIAYKDQTANTLTLVRCLQSACNGTKVYSTLDQGVAGIGPYTAVAVRADHRQVVAYQKNLPVAGGAAALYVAECATSSCTSAELVPVDVPAPGGSSGGAPDIAIDPDGAAVIAYEHPSALSLRLARCNAQTCAGPGDRLFQDGFQ